MTTIGPPHGRMKCRHDSAQRKARRGCTSIRCARAAYFFIGPCGGHVLDVAISPGYFMPSAFIGAAHKQKQSGAIFECLKAGAADTTKAEGVAFMRAAGQHWQATRTHTQQTAFGARPFAFLIRPMRNLK